MSIVNDDALKRIKAEVASNNIKCPICGKTEMTIPEEVFTLVKPSSDDDGSYSYIHGLNSIVLHTMPVICKECGHILFFSLDKQ